MKKLIGGGLMVLAIGLGMAPNRLCQTTHHQQLQN